MEIDRRASCEKHLLRLAGRQHGVVTRRQALEAGLTKSALQGRIRRGRLERMHPGVYCVGGSPRTFEQRVFAAAACGGPGAVVSHASAGHLWQMIEAAPSSSDIWSPRKRTRPPEGVCAHFTADLAARDRGRLRNIPVTSPVRTLIDLASVLPEAHVERALHQAIVDRRVAPRALHARLRDAPRQGARGPAVLRRLMASGRSQTSSPLERLVGEVLAGPGLPPFHREHPVCVEGGGLLPRLRLPALPRRGRGRLPAVAFRRSVVRAGPRPAQRPHRGGVEDLARDRGAGARRSGCRTGTRPADDRQGVKLPPVRQYSPASRAMKPSSTR